VAVAVAPIGGGQSDGLTPARQRLLDALATLGASA
jgi:hypothetical protein